MQSPGSATPHSPLRASLRWCGVGDLAWALLTPPRCWELALALPWPGSDWSKSPGTGLARHVPPRVSQRPAPRRPAAGVADPKRFVPFRERSVALRGGSSPVADLCCRVLCPAHLQAVERGLGVDARRRHPGQPICLEVVLDVDLSHGCTG